MQRLRLIRSKELHRVIGGRCSDAASLRQGRVEAMKRRLAPALEIGRNAAEPMRPAAQATRPDAVHDNRGRQVQASTSIGKEGEIVIAGTITRHLVVGGGKVAEWRSGGVNSLKERRPFAKIM